MNNPPPSLEKYRLLLSFVSVVLAWTLVSSAHAARSITQFGITWTFDRDYPSGQFANGDYWVKGPVKVLSISPRSTTQGGVTRHGSMINPEVNGPQGYDSRIKNNSYNATLNAGADLPLVLPPGTSLLSSESYEHHAIRDNPQLATIAILTVLSEPPASGSFRPPYLGTDKSIRWNKHQLQYGRLRSLPLVPNTPLLADVEKSFERPWIEQKTNWAGRYIHPGENQPAYGREIAHTLAQGLLSLQLNYSAAQKETLLIRLVQYGIDIYGAATNGARWNNDGGHNHGRKMPMLLAGAVLGDDAIQHLADARKNHIFQEDQQTWYIGVGDVGRLLFSADKRTRVPYQAIDLGIPEWGEKHTGDPARDGRNWNAPYRAVVGSSTIGHVLTAQLMDLQEDWNWPATFDYYDRYWSAEGGKSNKGANSIAPFVAEMWKSYRHFTPAKFTDRNVATEIWENTPIPLRSGWFTVAFDTIPSSNQMNGITGLSDRPANQLSDLVAAVRFSPSGRIDAKNGNHYQATNAFSYRAGEKYRVVMTVNVKTKRYSVSVTPRNGKPVRIAYSWKFPAEQSKTSKLNHIAFWSGNGHHAVMNVGVE